MRMYYGFSTANTAEEPAWFHTRDAAERFNEACGGGLGPVERVYDVSLLDVLDTPEEPWTKIGATD